MNRQTAKALAPIIKAFGDGNTIEISIGKDQWINAGEDVVFRGEPNYYRIKPKEQWRPFNCGELQRIVGKVVKHVNGSVAMITGAREERVYCEGNLISAETLLVNYVFVDTGDRCGVKVVQ